MSTSFSTAEEEQKFKTSKERVRKLTDDRKDNNGNANLAQTEGLKPIRTNGKRKNNTIVIDDDFEIDPRRIRRLNDVIVSEDE